METGTSYKKKKRPRIGHTIHWYYCNGSHASPIFMATEEETDEATLFGLNPTYNGLKL